MRIEKESSIIKKEEKDKEELIDVVKIRSIDDITEDKKQGQNKFERKNVHKRVDKYKK
mgnify:CR=1 FL=1